MPSAIGRSKRHDSLGRSAGARLTVTRLLCGNSSPLRLQRGTDALARFLDLGVGEADQGEARQAVGEVDLDRHGRRLEAAQGTAVNEGQAHGEFSADAACRRSPARVHRDGLDRIRVVPRRGTRRGHAPKRGAGAIAHAGTHPAKSMANIHKLQEPCP